MNALHITFTRTARMPAPEPLPEITETPRQAFLAGWWGGILVGMVLGAGVMVLVLHALGRLP